MRLADAPAPGALTVEVAYLSGISCNLPAVNAAI